VINLQRRAKECLTALGCALAMTLALPTGAEARPQAKLSPGSFLLYVELPPNRGWNMSLVASNHRQVDLIASKGAMSVRYRVVGRASTRFLKADFGSLGRVDLALDLNEAQPPPGYSPPKGRPSERRCRGKQPVELSGRFSGSVAFEGEANVVGVSTRSGRASVERTFRTVCRPLAKEEPSGKRKARRLPRIEFGLLAARDHSGGRTTSVEAFGLGLSSEVIFGLVTGSVHERLGRVRITRSALELLEEGTFKLAPKGQEGRTKLKPPKPFTGEASFRQESGSPASWLGDLAVRLPGGGTVPLAGPGFEARLCRTGSADGLKRCLLETRALGFSGALARHSYGSGSHSQPLALARLSSLR
jgi:hypothetical protein